MIYLQGQKYDELAHLMVVLQSGRDNVLKELEIHHKKSQFAINRLELYIKNVYYDKFNSNYHSLSINEEDKILTIYPKKEFIRVNSLYEEKKAKEESIIDKFFTRSFEDYCEQSLEDNRQLKKFFKENIKKVIMEKELTSTTLSNILDLIEEHSTIVDTISELHEVLGRMNSEFEDFINMAFGTICEDPKYEEIDIEEFQISTIKDKNGMSRLVLIEFEDCDDEDEYNELTEEDFLQLL